MQAARGLFNTTTPTVEGHMQNTYQEVESRLAKVVERAKYDPVIERLSAEISVLCRAHFAAAADITWRDGGLTANEAKLMQLLGSKPGQATTKAALMDAIYFDHAGDEPDMKIVDVMICKVRKKLEKANAPFWIETIHGTGYVFREGAAPADLAVSVNGSKQYRYFDSSRYALYQRKYQREHRKKNPPANAMAA